jgi:3',5'-cyclic AMP phosphodiesterase CpdA/CheY-like chemotaxis protein
MSETRPRVLIVEDTLKWQKAIMRCELLKQMRQRDPVSVVIVDTYQAAEDQLDACQFDLAITDVVLEENGGQFDWRSLARLLQREQVPIVVVSGHLGLDLVTEMVNEYGVFGVFDKNRLDPHKLSSRLSSILATRGGMPRATPGSKGVTWLHLSDLHFALSEQHDRSVVIEALWRDLERCRDRGLQANFIIVTGDIAYSGKVEEYELAGKFLDDLLDHTEVPKERLFLVPGNHDVDRSKILTLARQINALNNRNSVREVLEEHQSRSLFMTRLEGYASFVRSYFSDSADALVFDSKRYFYSRKFIINDWRIAVLGLNSTWTSGNIVVEGKVIDKGQLAVGEKQVMDALQMARDAQVKIAVMHHPLSYLYDFDRNDVANLLSRGCHFLLHGHLHEADVERRASLKGEMIVIPAGAIYQGRELINSYNYVTLDFERSRAQVIFRRYSDAQREWLKDLDATGETADGESEFDLQL